MKDSKIKGVKFYDKKVKRKTDEDKEFDDFDRQMAEFKIQFEEKLKTGAINKSVRISSSVTD